MWHYEWERSLSTQRCKKLSKFKNLRLRNFKFIKKVYLEVNDGELLSILGHNGAGKTTLIAILTGIL